MQQLAHLFAQKRVGKSGILTTEGYVDEDGNLIKENVNTHQLIAEFMILTNATVGNFFWQRIIYQQFIVLRMLVQRILIL